jgi:hypothetical protein
MITYPTTSPLPGFDEAKTADRFARRIEAYWASRGHRDVWCRVERVGSEQGPCAFYLIRSNLSRGLPPSATVSH